MFYTDQIGHRFELSHFPQRIVSLVPSQTEWLFSLGLAERIVGITKFCVHPADLCRKTPKIGGTKDFKIEKILALSPDLVLANKEENWQEGIALLQKKVPVWTSDISTLPEAIEMMRQVGRLTGKTEESEKNIQTIENQFLKLPIFPEKTALYLIWKKPYMAAGAGTFIDHLLLKAGFRNLIRQRRYPEISEEAIRQLAPEVILLSSEPYPFSGKHLAAIQALCPQAQVLLVDGESFSWYGSRLLYFCENIRKLRENMDG